MILLIHDEKQNMPQCYVKLQGTCLYKGKVIIEQLPLGLDLLLF